MHHQSSAPSLSLLHPHTPFHFPLSSYKYPKPAPLDSSNRQPRSIPTPPPLPPPIRSFSSSSSHPIELKPPIPMEIYMDDKWKLSKKESRSCRRMMVATDATTGPFLKGSASAREGRRPAAATSFSTRFASLVKEQRARFYIMRRCVTMLICWRDYP